MINEVNYLINELDISAKHAEEITKVGKPFMISINI